MLYVYDSGLESRDGVMARVELLRIVLSSSDRWRGIHVYDGAHIGHMEGYVQCI